jgi:hypothetical protein
MNTRYKYHYKSGLYFLNFPSNVIQKTVFTDGFVKNGKIFLKGVGGKFKGIKIFN